MSKEMHRYSGEIGRVTVNTMTLRGDMSAEPRRAHLIGIVRLIINDPIRSEGSVPSKTTSGTQHKVKLANRCGARADGVRPHPVLQQGRAEAFIEQDRRCGLADRTEGCHAHAPRSCPAHPQRKRSRVPKTRRFRHSVPRLSSISDAWGRLNVVTPFHHLSGDSHLHPSLAVQGPLRHLKHSVSFRFRRGGMFAHAPCWRTSALIQSASYPRSAKSIAPDFRRDKSLVASRFRP